MTHPLIMSVNMKQQHRLNIVRLCCVTRKDSNTTWWLTSNFMMISRSGDILEIWISMYLWQFWLKYVRSASYQHNITYTNKVRHEIVRNIANFKKMKKECTPHAPLRSIQIEWSPFLKGATSTVVTPQTWIRGTTFFLNFTKYVFFKTI